MEVVQDSQMDKVDPEAEEPEALQEKPNPQERSSSSPSSSMSSWIVDGFHHLLSPLLGGKLGPGDG